MVSSTFKNINTNATFIDSEFGPWEAAPTGANHPDKKLPHALSVEEIERRCQEKIPNIKIDRLTYVSTKIKCNFYHEDFGTWCTRPKDIIMGKAKRPKTISLIEFETMVPKDFEWKLDRPTFVDIKTKAKFVRDTCSIDLRYEATYKLVL